jgi:hypothetical protein
VTGRLQFTSHVEGKFKFRKYQTSLHEELASKLAMNPEIGKYCLEQSTVSYQIHGRAYDL